MSDRKSTFIGAVLAGDAALEDIDRWVELWHQSPIADDERTLHEFLGMTDEEYSTWVMHPIKLAEIVEAHRGTT